MNSDIVLEVDRVSKVFHLYDSPQDRLKEALSPFSRKYHHDFAALNEISFVIKKGESVGILGKNGAGKSTLLKIITGVLSQTSGAVHVKGRVASLLELGAGFNPEMTGIENIYLNGMLMGFSRKDMSDKIDAILSFADIGEYVNQPVKMYSSGMFARLAFSLSIHVDPDILIVDEALSVGDVFFQQKCNMFMKEKMDGVTKLIVTHDMATLASMTNKAILIDKGVKVIEGEPSKVIECYQKSVHTELFKGSMANNVSSSSTASLLDMGPDMKEISSDSLGGSLDVVPEKFSLVVNNHAFTDNAVIRCDDMLEVKVKIYVKKNIADLITGYIVRDKYGNDIFGESTLTSQIDLPSLESGGYIVSLRLKWPEIQKGEYFLTIGFGEGSDPLAHNVLCWAHNIAKVSSVLGENDIVHCLFNNKIVSAEIVGLCHA